MASLDGYIVYISTEEVDCSAVVDDHDEADNSILIIDELGIPRTLVLDDHDVEIHHNTNEIYLESSDG